MVMMTQSFVSFLNSRPTYIATDQINVVFHSASESASLTLDPFPGQLYTQQFLDSTKVPVGNTQKPLADTIFLCQYYLLPFLKGSILETWQQYKII